MTSGPQPSTSGHHQPFVIQLRGFEAAEAAAYKRDVAGTEVYLLDGGHFALEEQADQIADLTRDFLVTRLGRAG